MSDIAIKVENLSKLYQLGEVGTGTISKDLNRWWARIRGKEDPYSKVGQINDRSQKAKSDFVWALKDINFEVKQGEVLGIIGKNGAGKSTLLKILSKITSPSKGKIYTNGRIASLLEVGTGFHPEMTGRENIYLNGAILGMRKWEIDRKFEEIVDFAGAEAYIDTPVKRYSSGMYVRLAFAVAAYLEPEILIVDEVLAVGDVEFQKKCLGRMKEVSVNDGRTVLFVSHNMPAINNLCKTVIVLKNGQKHLEGSPEMAVNFYIDNFDFKIESEVQISNKNRQNQQSLEIEFISVKFLNVPTHNVFAVNQDIDLQLTLKANKNVSNFRLALGVSGFDETSVGTYFGEPIFSMNKGPHKNLNLKFNGHQLAKGKYFLSFSVGKGNEIEGLKDFDVVSKVLFFEIGFKDSISREMITVWDNSWGKINFSNILVKEF